MQLDDSLISGAVLRIWFILFKLAAPRWTIFTVKPALISGHTSISRYESIAMIEPGVILFRIEALPPKIIRSIVLNPERKVMKGKKKPEVFTRSMMAFL